MSDGLCILDPIVVDPGECDKYEDLNWCDGDGTCTNSVSAPDDPTLQSCPGDGGGGSYTPPPGGDPGTVCPESLTVKCPGEPSGDCEANCPDPDEEVDSDICPQPLMGKTLTTLVNVAGRNHEFQFTGTMRRVNPAIGRSPAWYYISGPTLSKDAWWMAESGTIQLVCWGGWRLRNSVWIGTVAVQATDLHIVMAPGHPDF